MCERKIVAGVTPEQPIGHSILNKSTPTPNKTNGRLSIMNAPAKQPLTIAGLLIALAGAILFSTKAIIVKKAFASTGVDAVLLLTLRMAFSLPFYLIAAYVISSREGNVKMTARQWWLTFAIGLTGYYFSSLFDFIGLQYISAGLERLILFLYPVSDSAE